MTLATEKQLAFIKTLLEKATIAFEASANAESHFGGEVTRQSFVRGLALLKRVNVPTHLDKSEASEIIDALKTLGGIEFVSELEAYVSGRLDWRSAFMKFAAALTPEAETSAAAEPELSEGEQALVGALSTEYQDATQVAPTMGWPYNSQMFGRFTAYYTAPFAIIDQLALSLHERGLIDLDWRAHSDGTNPPGKRPTFRLVRHE